MFSSSKEVNNWENCAQKIKVVNYKDKKKKYMNGCFLFYVCTVEFGYLYEM